MKALPGLKCNRKFTWSQNIILETTYYYEGICKWFALPECRGQKVGNLQPRRKDEVQHDWGNDEATVTHTGWPHKYDTKWKKNCVGMPGWLTV